jgi:hypothetical protein
MIDYGEGYYIVIDNNNCMPNWVEINELLYDMCAWMYTLMMIWWCEFDANWEGIIGMSGLLFMSRCIVLSSLCGMCTFMHSWVNLRWVPHDLKLTWDESPMT